VEDHVDGLVEEPDIFVDVLASESAAAEFVNIAAFELAVAVAFALAVAVAFAFVVVVVVVVVVAAADVFVALVVVVEILEAVEKSEARLN
jgi:hypothetical protein